jgi:hypothetical protein
LLALALGCPVSAETVTVTDPRPVDQAIRKLEDAYGWPITYEDPPYAFASDIKDTAEVRRDGKSASEPGVSRILVPRGGTFTFTFAPPQTREPGGRAPMEQARAAILEMLESYSSSLAGLPVFTLTESSGIFHVVPSQRRDAPGRMEKIESLFDFPVVIPPGTRTGQRFLEEICESLSSRAGYPVHIGMGAINMLATSRTSISSAPNESARSLMSRFFAEAAAPLLMLRRAVSWHAYYQQGWGYMLNFHVLVFTSAPPRNGAVNR